MSDWDYDPIKNDARGLDSRGFDARAEGNDGDLPPILREPEYHTLPTRRRAQPFVLFAPFGWLWRLSARVYWQWRGWPRA